MKVVALRDKTIMFPEEQLTPVREEWDHRISTLHSTPELKINVPAIHRRDFKLEQRSEVVVGLGQRLQALLQHPLP